jgi:hypothetical protein
MNFSDVADTAPVGPRFGDERVCIHGVPELAIS